MKLSRRELVAGGGVTGYFAGFASPSAGKVAVYLLTGDLCQMGTMEDRLQQAGFSVTRSRSGTYPGFVDKEEYHRALRYLFVNRVDGWWNQPLVEEGICSQDQFDEALTATR